MRLVLRKLTSFVLLGVLLVGSSASGAAPRDKAASKKIEEAIYTNFLNTDFDAAEGLLLGTIRACEDKCSPALLAKAWMYVGVVRGSGRNDMAGAKEAFTTALSTDPGIALDAEIANDQVKALWEKLKGGKGGGAAAPAAAPEAPAAASGGAFTCNPSPTEIETRRPVPLECETDAELKSAKLHYKSFGQEWTSVKMELNAGAWRGTIPCAATQNTGKLKYWVDGLDDDGKVVVRLGSKEEPQAADVVSETSADPPAFPDEEPPARCSVSDEPAGGAKAGGTCGAWGAPCGTDGCCNEGLTCNKGTCESAECKEDSDCGKGESCSSGKCEGEGKGGAYAQNLVSLQFAMDIASISTDKACAPESRKDHLACFDGKTTYEGIPNPHAAGKINGGFAPSTMRILATYERLFGAIGVEGRVGFAFNGGPTPKGGTAFLPVHAEARGKYWLMGESAFQKPGLRPWVHLGFGLAQIDATVKVQIADCSTAADPQACYNAPDAETARTTGAPIKSLNATKQLGQSFVTVGGGIMYAIGKNHGAVLNLNLMLPFPAVGFVVEPSLGYAVGF